MSRLSGFRSRIDLERLALATVNRRSIKSMSLAGLSGPAIESWAATAFSDLVVRARVVQLLHEISARAQLDSDRSRDVFVGEDLVPRNSIAPLLAQLEDICSGVA